MGDWPLLVVVTIAQSNWRCLPGDPSVGEPLWTWIKSTSVTSLKHGRSNNNNNSKDGVCLWRAEILDCCLRGKSKPRGSRSQSLIDWPYWNHFIAYRCSSACSLSLGSSRASIKPATLMSETSQHYMPHGLFPNMYSRLHPSWYSPFNVASKLSSQFSVSLG